MSITTSTDKSVIRSWRVIQLVIAIVVAFGTLQVLESMKEKEALQHQTTTPFEGDVPTLE